MHSNSGVFSSVRARTLRQEVAEALREAILSGKLKPGQRLVEADLAREMGVSRIPIREAIGQLEQQGLVTVVPNQGACVMRPSQEDSYEAQALRMHLEVLAARLAAVRRDPQSLRDMAEVVRQMAALNVDEGADPAQVAYEEWALDREFHHRLAQASGSAVLLRIWSTVGPFIWANVHLGVVDLEGSWPPADLKDFLQSSVQIHQFLLDAVSSGDISRAEEAMRRHSRDLFRCTGTDAGALERLGWPIVSED